MKTVLEKMRERVEFCELNNIEPESIESGYGSAVLRISRNDFDRIAEGRSVRRKIDGDWQYLYCDFDGIEVKVMECIGRDKPSESVIPCWRPFGVAELQVSMGPDEQTKAEAVTH